MAIDYSKLSDEELEAIANNDYSKLSDATLAMLSGEAPKVEPLPRGPTTRGGKRTPGVPLNQPSDTRFPTLPRDIRTPQDVDVRRGASGLLGIPGGFLDIATGLTGILGENAASRWLREKEQELAAQTSSKEGYEAGKIVPQIIPAAATAKAVSMLPIASRLGMAGAQVLGQAGQAYAVTPSEPEKNFSDLVLEKEPETRIFGLGPRREAAVIEGALGAAGEVAPYLISGGRQALAAGKRLFSNIGPQGATPEELAALRITQGKDVGREEAERELAAAREAERLKQEQVQSLKQKYLEQKVLRNKQKADLQTQKAAAKEEGFQIKSESDKAIADAKAKQESMQIQLQDKARELRDEAKGTDKVLEETNIREAGAEAAGTLEDRAKSFRELSEKLAKEAEDAAQVKVEMPEVRTKNERATSFRDMILNRLERLKTAREEAIGRTVDPVTGVAEPLPFLRGALQKEDLGQTVSDTKAFKDLVASSKERAEGITAYGEPIRRPRERLLREIQPVKETVDENGQIVREILPIRYEKLIQERRMIAEPRTGEEYTGYAAISSQEREILLKEIDAVLEEFGPGYKDYMKEYTRTSKPIDELKFGVGEKAIETRKFTRDKFVNDPETVLDAALSKPSKSSAERLKASYFDESDYDELESIVRESLTEKAGGTAKGYEKVLKDYGEFLEEFPAARDAIRADADRFVLASDEAAKISAFKKRWAEKMEERAKRAERAVASISGLQAKVKTSLGSPLKEGALDEIAAFTRANPNMRPKIGAALQDVLKSVDDKTIVRALEVPERQAAFMRAGMEREQIADVLDTARRNIADRAAKVDEVRQMGLAVREAKKTTKETAQAGEEAQKAAAQKVRETGREIGRLDEAGKAEGLAVDQAAAEFQAARNLRVTAQEKRKALSNLTLEMRDAINLAAEQIPLNTTEGLARAVTLAGIFGGGATAIAGAPVTGGIALLAASVAGPARRAYAKRQQKTIATEIETIVNKIMQDETGGVASAIGKKIERAEQIADAQRIANKALSRIGIKPGVGAVSANTIYKAFAKEPEEGTETEEAEPTQESTQEPTQEAIQESTQESAQENAQAPAQPEQPVEEKPTESTSVIDKTIASQNAEHLRPIIESIYEQESSSGRNPLAERENYAGAAGGMQVTPIAFEEVKRVGYIPEDYELSNPEHRFEAGVAYIRYLADKYNNDPAKIAAAYYGGPSAITNSGINRNRRDPKNSNAPTVGEYVDEVLKRIVPTAEARQMARGGVVYTPQEEMLLKKYSNGGASKRPTLPADRSTGYKKSGEKDEYALKRFFESAAQELPSAIKDSVTSNADLAAKYLKFKFGMMSPDEMMMVARSLPQALRGAAVAAMQAVKEAPKAVAEATPETAGKFAGQMIAGEMTDPLKLVRGMPKPTMAELDVYHGTPHRFPATEANPLGEFDASKIGTGEGAQAYGHGVYLAQAPDVAEGYRRTLVGKINDRVTVDGKPVKDDIFGRAVEKMGLFGKKSALQDIDDQINFYSKYEPDFAEYYKSARKQIEDLDPESVKVNKGSLYKADLPDEMIDRMLDFDKPFLDQSQEIKDFAKTMLPPRVYDRVLMERTGDFIEALGVYKGGKAKAAELLRQAGIPGIKYLDAGSRGQGSSGTRNFVVFPGEEKKVRILERK